MSGKKIHLPFNRVEGDLEIHLEFEGNIIKDAWSVGTMYRGFENILSGRSPLDSLVITPRICGICSTSHLTAAAQALDMAFKVTIPDNAKRIRNISLIAEILQNDIRHAFFMFMPDCINPLYKKFSLFNEAVDRYKPLKGQTVIQTIQESKKLLEIIAILGGQWPHSSFMIPGGVIVSPSHSNLIQCRYLLNNYRKWYETKILGCSIERWSCVNSKADLDIWLEENDSHRNSELGFYLNFAKKAGFDNIGSGHGNFISFGALPMPEHTQVTGFDNGDRLFPSGFVNKGKKYKFDHQKITEDIAASWYKNEPESGPAQHPFNSFTKPYATGYDGKRYSWAKAPRYDGLPAETGPLAEMIISDEPLFADLLKTYGTPNVFIRQLARIVRSTILIPVMDLWLRELLEKPVKFLENYKNITDSSGLGLMQAPRGALGHWITIKDSKIERYQIIPPTTWNASPRDQKSVRGPWEEALVGTVIKDIDNPIEVEHIIRSFDPCLVCTVHTVNMKSKSLYISC